MILSVASLNQTPLDWRGNLARIREAIRAAKREGASLLCLPELCLTGFGCQNHFRREEVAEKGANLLRELLPETNDVAVALGLPVRFEGKVYNAAPLLAGGKIVAVQCKTRLTSRYYSESRWFHPWESGRQERYSLVGEIVPIGDFHSIACPIPGRENPLPLKIVLGDFEESGPTANEPSSTLEPNKLVLHLAADPFTLGRFAERKRRLEAITGRFQGHYLFSNLLGNESGAYIFDGGSCIARLGKILAQTQHFSYHDMQLVSIDTDSVDNEKEPVGPQPDSRSETRDEEFAQAVGLGLFDYLRKSASQGFVLSLSGGADSAAVALCVYYMVRFAAEELELKGVCEKLRHIPNLSESRNPKELTGQLLNCVYQASRNSGPTTRSAAQTLAEGIGARFHEIDISEIIDRYTDLVRPLFERPITWEHDDAALQNIQARVRVPGLWLLANLKNALLLNTGNRSEATLGYTTLDGDSCGGLAPIGGIDKAFLRNWLRWAETAGPLIGDRRIPVPELKEVNDQEPTAELRPPGSSQTDEGDLMPYAVLERIEKIGIVGNHTLPETVELLASEFPQHARAEIERWVERFFSLWTRNQWKRNRYALSFHLDGDSLSPDDWRSFPTLLGKDAFDGVRKT